MFSFRVVSLVVLSYRLTAETGRRTGSSLFFFSTVFYLIGVYVSFYITLRFGIITNSELVVIQLFYLAGGFLLVLGSISLYNFFIRATNIGNLNTAFKKVALFRFNLCHIFASLFFDRIVWQVPLCLH
jgi:hypothetical protein